MDKGYSGVIAFWEGFSIIQIIASVYLYLMHSMLDTVPGDRIVALNKADRFSIATAVTLLGKMDNK